MENILHFWPFVKYQHSLSEAFSSSYRVSPNSASICAWSTFHTTSKASVFLCITQALFSSQGSTLTSPRKQKSFRKQNLKEWYDPWESWKSHGCVYPLHPGQHRLAVEWQHPKKWRTDVSESCSWSRAKDRAWAFVFLFMCRKMKLVDEVVDDYK